MASEIDSNNESLLAEAAQQPQASEQEKSLAQTAQTDFEKSNYAAALQSLSKLESSRTDQHKVTHNKAVVNCYKSGLVNISQFRKSLQTISKQMQCNLEDPQTLVDVDQCYIFYNEAVTLYYLRQYVKSLHILTKIFSLIEQLDEGLARKVCFLLAEVYLRLNCPDKTLNVVFFMETSLLSHGAKLKSTLPLEKERDKDKDTEKEKEDLKGGYSEESLIPQAVRIRLLRLKIRSNLALFRAVEAEKEAALLAEIDPESAATYCLKSHIEFIKNNPTSALKLLNPVAQKEEKCFKEQGESHAVMHHNNAGCIYISSGKYHLASLQFQKALAKNTELLAEFPKPTSGDPLANRPLLTIGSNYKYEILYNLGVTLLHARKPTEAFDCLIEAVQLHQRDPLIWLRLAECCIHVHKPDNQRDFQLSDRKRDIIQGSAGLGSHRKVILTPRISSDDCQSSENAAIPVPTLEFAVLALRNAEFLLNRLTVPKSDPGENLDPEEADPKGKPDLTVTLSEVTTLSKLRKPHYAHLKNTVVADSSYVALCLGDYLTSLHKAEHLLMQPDLSGNHKLLGHLYAAESLILLNRINEAIPHLHPDNISQLSHFPSVDDSNAVRHNAVWFPSTTQTAKVVLQYNLSVVYALRGEHEKAGELLRQLWTAKTLGIDVPIQVVQLALYVELQLGHVDVARTIIKQHCPQYR